MRKEAGLENKKKINISVLVSKIVVFALVLGLVYISFEPEMKTASFNLKQTAFLYEGNQLVGVNVGAQADELTNAYNQQRNEILGANQDAASLNTSVIQAPSLIAFTVSEQEQSDVIKYAEDKTKILENGYTLSIDGKYNYYINNREDLDWVIDQILLAYLPDESYYEYFKNTGNFRPYESGDKRYTSIDVLNDIKISEGYKSGSKTVETREDLLFELFHEDQLRQYNVISDQNNIKVIKEQNKLEDFEFKLNNPNLGENTVTYNGQQIIVNKADPIIDVATTYETTKTEELDYEIVTETNEDMQKGEFTISSEGEAGEKVITYEHILVDGKVVSTTKVKEEVTKKPVHKVISVGPGTVISTISDQVGDLTPSTEKSNGFIWPSSSRTVSCEYGCYSNHQGIDIVSYPGGPIYAAKEGIVKTAGWSSGGYGYYVVIDHGGGVETIYGHQSKQPPVVAGQYVEQGQVIGFEGTTGRSTGVHLHFEIKINGTKVNPRGYI